MTTKLENFKPKLKIKSAKFSCAIFFIIFWISAPILANASERDGMILIDGDNAGFAWSSNSGLVNFSLSAGNIHITNTGITGSAWNGSYGWIDMSPANGGVTNDGNGVLGGYAWGDKLDWINFSGVTIDSSGRFHGRATGSLIGSLSFDCTDCDVRTDWRPVVVQGSSIPEGSILTGATTEAPMPPATVEEAQPPLFDISAEPPTSAHDNFFSRVVLPIILNVVLILFIAFIARQIAVYFIRRMKIKKRSRINNATLK